ncbi:hypothetical protein [Bradyrhizobium sp. Tv2a-2]|uniref:hypothetical protein n=1 Tax=Bradyrhizobium sp. Tv2a-2 TaxID=113395 RepID=UPI0003F85CD3|nr:hypothetical protein [Bradyrhizobium sp. Tv2a-2]
MTKLSKRRLEAIEEALHARLAGHLDDTNIPREFYEGALAWAEQQLERRSQAADKETKHER